MDVCLSAECLHVCMSVMYVPEVDIHSESERSDRLVKDALGGVGKTCRSIVRDASPCSPYASISIHRKLSQWPQGEGILCAECTTAI